MKLHIAPLILIMMTLGSYVSAQPAKLKGTSVAPLQELNEIDFKRLTYDATSAWFSPSVTVKLDNRKILSLSITNPYPSGNGELPTGDYTAVLDDSTFQKFIKTLQNSSIRSMKFGTQEVKDSPEITLDIYFNGQHKYLKGTDVPTVANDLLASSGVCSGIRV